jgi:ferredoxin
MHQSRSQVAGEVSACIRCNECLAACPALPTRIQIETLNRETLGERISPDVARFAHACYQCGACVPVCPVGLHRDAMMLWLKMRLLHSTANNAGSGRGDGGDGGDGYDRRAARWR